MSNPSELDKELIIEEYKSCRELIGRNIDLVDKNEVYVIGACAAVFAFSVEKDNTLLATFSAWLPLGLSLIGKARFEALHVTISKINDYLIQQEIKHKIIGFTKFYEQYEKKDSFSVLKLARDRVWLGLIIISTVFGVYKSWIYVEGSRRYCSLFPNATWLCKPDDQPKSSN